MTQNDILLLVKKLGCTPEEAKEILAEDERIDKMTVAEAQADLTAEQKKAIKTASATGSRKRTPTKRERKIDPDKLFLINALDDCCYNLVDNEITKRKNENEISFSYNGSEYTIKLIKHRPPKGDKK